MSHRWRKLGLWIAITLILAVGIHYAVMILYPRIIMSSLMGRLEGSVGKNALRHRPRPDSGSRHVVMPSPDLIYSSGVFDLSDGPLVITAPTGKMYMSLSLYADNTDNFFVVNDLQVKNGKFEVGLLGPADPDMCIEGALTVRSPTKRGFILFRFFADETVKADELDALRKAIRIEGFK